MAAAVIARTGGSGLEVGANAMVMVEGGGREKIDDVAI